MKVIVGINDYYKGPILIFCKDRLVIYYQRRTNSSPSSLSDFLSWILPFNFVYRNLFWITKSSCFADWTIYFFKWWCCYSWGTCSLSWCGANGESSRMWFVFTIVPTLHDKIVYATSFSCLFDFLMDHFFPKEICAAFSIDLFQFCTEIVYQVFLFFMSCLLFNAQTYSSGCFVNFFPTFFYLSVSENIFLFLNSIIRS